ncbi:MAG: twin-arginine translocase subunit TatB [Kordiimonadaceae bacterium]|nr:twin-arginine translocase subunit TatB [Kordiimonadaceae bacterium]MBO6570599.1 twin-arginine translocase subunit TatB [Kordiimonadaceae bacterium]MBO6966543.1 twin-arginine translocase subunit TatB [Kordiimonadaceae bacterium]
MLDIGAMELFVVAILALVVVGPKELPKLLRTVGGFMRKVREMAAEFRSGVEDLAAEVEREVDPFSDLRKEEGLRPGMSPEEITEHILANKEREAIENIGADEESDDAGPKTNEKSSKSDENGPKASTAEGNQS